MTRERAEEFARNYQLNHSVNGLEIEVPDGIFKRDDAGDCVKLGVRREIVSKQVRQMRMLKGGFVIATVRLFRLKRVRRAVSYTAVFCAALGACLWYGEYKRGLRKEGNLALMSIDFESDPRVSGWSARNPFQGWTQREFCSGIRALDVSDNAWKSPILRADAFQWYRLSFNSKDPEAEPSGDRSQSLRCLIEFYDRKGESVQASTAFDVSSSKSWQKSELLFRSNPSVSRDGVVNASNLSVKFVGSVGARVFVDDVAIEKAAGGSVARWADGFNDSTPAILGYQPEGYRLSRIPESLRKLQKGQSLRIGFVGGQTVREIASAPIDVLLQRLYPGSRVEVVMLPFEWDGELGLGETVEHVSRLQLDLLVLSRDGVAVNYGELKSFLERLTLSSTLLGKRFEAMIVSNSSLLAGGRMSYSPVNVVKGERDHIYSGNDRATLGRTGDMMAFAKRENVEFLDMATFFNDFAVGSAATANNGVSTDHDGVPVGILAGAFFRSSEGVRHVLGRILESHFSPRFLVELSPARDKVSREDPSVQGIAVAAAEVRERLKISRGEKVVATTEMSGLSGFEVRGMSFINGVGVVEGGAGFAQCSKVFDEPVDLRKSDLSLYWESHADRENLGKQSVVLLNLSFTPPPRDGHPAGANISMDVRSGDGTRIAIDSGWQMDNLFQVLLDPPFELFASKGKPEQFRLQVRWAGGDRVLLEPSSWNVRTGRWEGFPPFGRPGAVPQRLEVSISKHMLGQFSFKAVSLQLPSEASMLGPVVVAVRPAPWR